MEYGFVKTAAVSPKIRVADPVYNGTEIIRLMKETWEKGARIIVFPELCITGYTCSDLFRQELLLKTAKEVLMEIVEASAGMDGLFFVGLPLENRGKLYNVAAAYSDGNKVDSWGNPIYSVIGMARWNPTQGRKGGFGGYYFEYEYNTTRPANQAIGDKEKAAIPYYSLRRGIQEQNPAGKPVQQSTKQETEEENG